MSVDEERSSMSEQSRLEHISRNFTKPARLFCLGSSDAFNSCGRANSCFWVDDHDGSYLIDCGPTTMQALKRATDHISLQTLDVIYLTHLHGDHINGLPVLLLELSFGQQRQRPLWIIGPTTTKDRIVALCEVSYPTMLSMLISFKIHFEEHPIEHEGICGGRHLKSITAQHDPLAYPTSLCLTDSAGCSLTFSGDTGWSDELISLSAQNDIFVLECSYAKSYFPGHISLEEIAEIRSRLTPTRLILTHLGVESRSAALSRKDELMFEVADDGSQWLIEPGPD